MFELIIQNNQTVNARKSELLSVCIAFENCSRLWLLLQVKLWLTLNEPIAMAWLGYGTGFFAPGVRKEDVGSYEVAHNLIKAHAEAWHTYDEEFRQKQNGLLLFSISFHYLIKKFMQCDAGLLVQCLMTV